MRNRRAIVALFVGFILGSLATGAAVGLTAPERSAVVAARDKAQSLVNDLNAILATTTTTVPGPTTTAAPTTSSSTTTTTLPTGGAQPFGVPGSWTQTFGDEFNGTALDTAKWNTSGSWECCDGGRSNLGPNGELDYKTAPPSANYTFDGNNLTIHGIREPSHNLNWTGGQLGSKQVFTYGFIETRAQFSPTTGFQPAFWTWGTGTNPHAQETDGFEFYGDNHTQLYLTAAGTPTCHYTMPFDPTTGMHVYGTDMEPTGTTFYVDGVKVCPTVAGHPTGPWTLIMYQVALASWRAPTPAASTTHAEYVSDYVRLWTR